MNRRAMLLRMMIVLLLSVAVAGCDAIGDIFQAGFIVGIIAVVVVLLAISWLWRMIRNRGNPR